MDEHECDGMIHVCRSSFHRSLFALTIPYSHFVFSPTIHTPGRSAGFRCPLCLLNLAPLLIIILILIALSAHSPPVPCTYNHCSVALLRRKSSDVFIDASIRLFPIVILVA